MPELELAVHKLPVEEQSMKIQSYTSREEKKMVVIHHVNHAHFNNVLGVRTNRTYRF